MLTSTNNCGYLLSTYIGYPSFVYFSIVLLFVFLFFFFTYFYKKKDRFGLFGTFMVFSGGGFNLAERIFNNGCVHDYINFFGLFAFNIYDLMIDVGIILVIYRYLLRSNTYENRNNI